MILAVAGGILLAVLVLDAVDIFAAIVVWLVVLGIVAVLVDDHPVIAGLLFAAWVWSHIERARL